jgi:plasmid stabilization system protein ParE
VIVRVPESVYDAINEATDYSLAHFGLDTSEQLGNRLYDGLEQTAWNYGKRIAGLRDSYRYISVKPYNLFYRRNEQVGEVVVYLVRHQSRQPLGPDEHQQLADWADRTAHRLPPSNH